MVAGLVVEVEGVKDTQTQRFASIRISASADCPSNKLQEIVRKAKQYCYVTNSLSPQVRLEISVRADEGTGGPWICKTFPI
jgi:uncharacterized OsmC-like protein